MINSKKIVFDVGAHKGEDSKYYLARGYKVIAFECSPLNIKFLKERFKNEIKSNDLVIETRALVCGGSADKKLEFFVDDISVWGTLNINWAKRNERLGSNYKSILVDTLDPKEIYNLYGIPYFIKIDIEGSDMDVLKSLKYLKYENRPKYLSLESSKTSWTALIEEFALLKKLQYVNFQAIPQGKISKIITKWKNNEGKIIAYHHEKDSSGPFGEDLRNNWKDLKKIKFIYKFIFMRYFLFGDDGIFAPRKIKIRILRFIYNKVLKLFFLSPDWFDTHAKLKDTK